MADRRREPGNNNELIRMFGIPSRSIDRNRCKVMLVVLLVGLAPAVTATSLAGATSVDDGATDGSALAETALSGTGGTATPGEEVRLIYQ